MAKIHGIVYLLIGIIVTLMSWYMDKKVGKDPFILFLYVGLFMVLIGTIKIIHKIATKEKIPKTHHHNLAVRYCARCGSALRHFEDFCYRCGTRILRKH